MLRKVSEVPVRIFGSARAVVRECVGQRRASTAAAPRPKLNNRPNPIIPSAPTINPMTVGVPAPQPWTAAVPTIPLESELFKFEGSQSGSLTHSDIGRLSVLTALLEANHSLRLCDTLHWNYVVVYDKSSMIVELRLDGDTFVTTLNGQQLLIPRSSLSRSSDFSVDGKRRLANVNAPHLSICGRGAHPEWTIALNDQEHQFRIYLPHVHSKLPLMPIHKPAVVIKDILSPLAGVVTQMKVKEGDKVVKGQEICILEAMKMQNNLVAAGDGVVTKILANVGQTVADQALLVKIE